MRRISLVLAFLGIYVLALSQSTPTTDSLAAKSDFQLCVASELETAYLKYPNGRYLHTWSYHQGFEWDHAELLPNGHLLVVVKNRMIIELDWESKIVWQANLAAHDDLARHSNGKTWVLSQEYKASPWSIGKKLKIDRIVPFDRKGEFDAYWKFEEHMKELISLLGDDIRPQSEDRFWPHFRSIEVLEANPSGETDKRFRAGNLLVSAQNGRFIAIIHRNNGSILWAWHNDQLRAPISVSMLPNGNLQIWDQLEGVDQYQVFELNPVSKNIVQVDRRPFLSKNGTSLLPRQISYEAIEINPLLKRFGTTSNFTHKEWKEINRRRVDQQQYKRLNRETFAQIELGYLDEAEAFQTTLLEAFPDDDEGLFLMSLIQAQKRNIPEAMKYVEMAIEKGFRIERYFIDLGDLLDPLVQSEAFKTFVKKQTSTPITHGPMLGKITDHSASVWLRSAGKRQMSIHVKTADGKMIEHSRLFSTKAEDNYTYEFLISGLQADQEYMYEIWVKHQQVGPAYSFRTATKQGESTHFRLGFGGGAGYTPMYERMWDTLGTHELDLFLAMGDNVYIDHPERPLTQQYCYHRRQSRAEYRRFVGNTAQYAIWDDHDFTYNDDRGGPDRNNPDWKRDVLAVFQQQWLNPAYGGGEIDPGIWHHFSYGDVDFFMLDCRYYRENPTNNPSASMLGSVQKAWLKEQLKQSTATFKIIASSVPWAQNTKPGSLDTWDGHPEEREEIFSFLETENIEGVVLLSADRHRSDAWRIERPDGYPLYDFMSSRLTNVHVHDVMPGALFGYNKTPSFGLLEFDTTQEDPSLIYRIISIDNEEIHRMTVYRSQLERK